MQRPARGETVCGDTFSIVSNKSTLIALADGLGHGPKAAEASLLFCRYAVKNTTPDLPDCIEGASLALSGTRGAAAALVRIDPTRKTLSFCGVGNIELQAVSRNLIRPVCTPGIVGRRIRKIIQFDYEIHRGDLFALYSDGISSRYNLEQYRSMDVQEIADAILADLGKDHDDVTCIVFRL